MGEAQFRLLRCKTAGVEAVAAGTALAFARHTHEQFGIGAILSGAQRSHSGRGQVEASVGNAITVNPGEVHDGAPVGDGGRSWAILYFDPPIVAAAAEDVFGSGGGQFEYTRPVILDPRVAAAFWRLYCAETGASASPILREELLLALTTLAGRRASSVRAEPPAPVKAAMGRIEDDPASPASLAELAALGGVSRFQLIRGFAHATGLTPHAYQVQRRAELARRLIGARVPLAAAAAAAGFADQSHMTRTFARRFGVSPGAYAAAAR